MTMKLAIVMNAKLVWEHSLLLSSTWRQARREMLQEDSSGSALDMKMISV